MRKSAVALLLLLIAAAAIGWWRTLPPSPKAIERRAALSSAALVDESFFATAEHLARLAREPDEQPFVSDALRVADHELALAFTAALRDVEAHPPPLSPDALQLKDRLRKSSALLDADRKRVAALTAALASAKSADETSLNDELQLAQSQLDLDQDEVEEDSQDLAAAGGNPQQRIDALAQEHAAQMKAHAVSAVQAAVTPITSGGVGEFREWLRLRRELQALALAQAAARDAALQLAAQRGALAGALENAKAGISELAPHTKAAKSAGAVPLLPGATPRNHDDAAALLAHTLLITADQKVLTLLDRQRSDLEQLARVYQNWQPVVQAHGNASAHRLLLDAALVAAVLLAVVLFDSALSRFINNPKLDRRQAETLRSVVRMTVRVVALLVIVLVLIGVPGRFGTVLGIVGAGLTVALKDFIVAFFGWLVLMGRNGIRLGDWVEINGVSGEVTQLGMFHTVLLETGNWSDAGHPTGRRVTFTNSFAIEGHYFNFSTSGQWLWDELTLVIPSGQDPYPIFEAITRAVRHATADGARQAEQEWQRAVPAQGAGNFSGEPSVNLKPVLGGVEIAVRYITRANERFKLRSTLYQAAVDLLGGRPAAA